MNKFLWRLWRGNDGAGLVEYALLIVVIALGSVAGMGVLGVSVNSLFESLGSLMSAASINIP